MPERLTGKACLKLLLQELRRPSNITKITTVDQLHPDAWDYGNRKRDPETGVWYRQFTAYDRKVSAKVYSSKSDTRVLKIEIDKPAD